MFFNCQLKTHYDKELGEMHLRQLVFKNFYVTPEM